MRLEKSRDPWLVSCAGDKGSEGGEEGSGSGTLLAAPGGHTNGGLEVARLGDGRGGDADKEKSNQAVCRGGRGAARMRRQEVVRVTTSHARVPCWTRVRCVWVASAGWR
jgi:hypothetical protein